MPLGRGTKSRAITVSLTPPCGGYNGALRIEKLSPSFSVGAGSVITNDWCITLNNHYGSFSRACFNMAGYGSSLSIHCSINPDIWVHYSQAVRITLVITFAATVKEYLWPWPLTLAFVMAGATAPLFAWIKYSKPCWICKKNAAVFHNDEKNYKREA